MLIHHLPGTHDIICVLSIFLYILSYYNGGDASQQDRRYTKGIGTTIKPLWMIYNQADMFHITAMFSKS